MKYIFIVNPVAGRGKALKLVPKIEKICIERKLEYEIRYTKIEKSATQIAREYIDGGYIIYSVGGDGVLNQVLNGIVGTNNILGIIPAGSGNDFYKVLKDREEGKIEIDIGRINNTYFINTACIGIDAEVGNNTDLFRDTIVPVSQLYNASIVYTFLTYKFRKIKFVTPTKITKKEYTIISICNGKFYGGGYCIAPKAEINDGLFDIYYADKLNRIQILYLISKLKKGNHEGKRKVHKFRTNHVELETDNKITFNIDGEKLTDNKFVIDLIPKAVIIENDKSFVDEILNK